MNKADFVSRLAANGECLIWQGPIDSKGYGHMKYDGRTMRAHRVAYSLANDWALPDKGDHSAVVMHSCDNRACCNPAHLTLGTQDENIADMVAKGRASRKFGERNGRAKLSAVQVDAIRSSNYGKVRLSRIYPVSPAQIQRIRAGKQWAA